jgi:aspartyl-tRNA(Asn)/glutamyl-tRNA(Gln) amidotransferase subunit A
VNHNRRHFLELTGGGFMAAALPLHPESFPPTGTGPTDLTKLSLWEASDLVRTKKVSPTELTKACLKAIDHINPMLNAFITVTSEQALVDAKAAEAEIVKGRWKGRLHGIPIGLKDLFDTAGVRTTAASAFFADRIPTQDAEVVRRLKAAGAVVVGKHNMHEFAFGATSVLSHFGAVHNPWNRDYVAGGSSGGSAASVAAGLCFGALGSDTGGSIRIPAAHCGIVGLKPTYGRVSVSGVIPLSWSLDHVGPITRTVADAAVLLQAIAGYDAQEVTSVDLPVPDYVGMIKRGVSPLRVGVPREYFFAALHPDVESVVAEALSVVSRLTAGMQDIVVPVNPDVNTNVMPAEAYAFHASRVAQHPELFKPAVLGRLRQGEAVSVTSYIQQRRELDRARRAAPRLFTQVDLLVAPSIPVLPVRIDDAKDDEESVAQFARNARPFNTYGLPAITVPCGFSKSGLPIGLQIAGPPWGEAAVLRLAHAYEQETKWHTRRPPL